VYCNQDNKSKEERKNRQKASGTKSIRVKAARRDKRRARIKV